MANRRTLSCQQILAAALYLLVFSSAAHADTKRGMAGIQAPRENAMNARWAYNWGNGLPSTIDDFHGQFVPMIWSASTGGVHNQINNILSYKDDYNIEHVLGFNEPERTDQANMSVQQAIDVWDIMTDQFAGTGIKLVSPAVSGSGGLNNWFTPFMAEVEARNSDADQNNDLQVDAIAFHWYSTGSNPISQANNILNAIDNLWADYGRPIWLTEFAGVDFSGNTPTATKVQFNIEFLDYIIPRLESRAHVERYSWWQFGIGGKPYSQLSSNSGGVYTPTSIGDEYVGALQSGDSYDFASGVKQPTDIHYLRGGTLTNTGTAVTTALRAIDAVEGDSTISGTADWGLSGGSDSLVRIRAGATLHKAGVGTTRIQGSPVENAGELRATAGTLSFENGTQVTGAGTLHVDAGGTIALGAATDSAGAVIAQTVDLRGGMIQSNPISSGSHVISSTMTAHDTTTFSGEGQLFVTGAINAPAGGGGGGVVKSGTGTVLFNGNNTYAGNTVVDEGTLRLGFAGTLGNGSNIDVGIDGVLDVFAKAGGYTLNGQTLSLKGQLAGSINATNGSIVRVTDSDASLTGNLTVSNSTVSVGGSGFNEDASPPPPLVTTGLQLNFDAALDTGGDATWDNAADAASNLAFSASTSPNAVNDNSVLGLSAAYDISASGSATGLINYFELQSPPRSQKDATFEVVFHVSDTEAGADQVLFEVGATRGVSFTLSGADLAFNVAGDSGTSTLNTNLGIGWHHAVGVIDLVGIDDDLANDSMELFVNNVSIGTISNVLVDDWTNGSLIGIGGDAFGTAGTSSPSDFHGEIASARYYEDMLFSASEVAQNYMHILGLGVGESTTMVVKGNYTQDADGTLEIDLLSPTMHDELDVVGMASLAGMLEVAAIEGFDPDFGDAFTILSAAGGITGEFDAMILPSLDMGKSFLVEYGSNEVVLTVVGAAADFDLDGDVDSDDLVVWQNSYGINSSADADGDGDSDGADYLIWQNEFTGQLIPPAASAAVPEPNTLSLLAVASALMFRVIACRGSCPVNRRA